MVSLSHLPSDVFRYHILPHLHEINVVKTCRALWRMRFIARQVLIENVLRSRGTDLRIAVYRKIADFESFKRDPILEFYPKVFDRDIADTYSKELKAQLHKKQSPYVGFGKLWYAFNDIDRKCKDKFCIPECHISDITKTVFSQRGRHHLTITREADTIDHITFDKPVMNFTLLINDSTGKEVSCEFGDIRELTFSLPLPICLMPYSRIALRFDTNDHTTIMIKKTWLDQDSRLAILHSMTPSIYVISDTGLMNEITCGRIVGGCADVTYAECKTLTEFRRLKTISENPHENN